MQQQIKLLTNYCQRLEQLAIARNYELELLRAKETDARRTKSTFLANMSHEFLTPLNVINGFTYILLSKLTIPEQIAYLQKIEASTNHLLSMIRNILDLSNINSWDFKLEMANFSLEDMLCSVQTSASDLAMRKGLNIKLINEVGSKCFEGDHFRLCQIILNYLDNAIKFSDHGTIWLKVELLEANKLSYLLRFEVQDSGIGIPEEAIPELFDAFTQADLSSTRKYGGTGVGLAITQSLANILGGQVGVESNLGQGSTFWFTVRLKPVN